jgi:protein TonB
MTGKRTKFVSPQYPPIAKVTNTSGAVVLGVVISGDGSVENVVPIAASNPFFVGTAVEAVKQWVFQPYLLNGEPTEVETTITVNFSIL